MKDEQLKLFDFREKGQKKLFLSVSIDVIGFCVVFVVLLVVFSYILGVERGKRAAFGRLSPRQEAREQKTDVSLGVSPQHETTEGESVSDIAAQNDPEDSATDSVVNGYTIQVASYKYTSAAEREKKKLEQKGYHATIVRKGDYLAVLVGMYPARETALKTLQDLKNHYKDCFVRRLYQ